MKLKLKAQINCELIEIKLYFKRKLPKRAELKFRVKLMKNYTNMFSFITGASALLRWDRNHQL